MSDGIEAPDSEVNTAQLMEIVEAEKSEAEKRAAEKSTTEGGEASRGAAESNAEKTAEESKDKTAEEVQHPPKTGDGHDKEDPASGDSIPAAQRDPFEEYVEGRGEQGTVTPGGSQVVTPGGSQVEQQRSNRDGVYPSFKNVSHLRAVQQARLNEDPMLAQLGASAPAYHRMPDAPPREEQAVVPGEEQTFAPVDPWKNQSSGSHSVAPEEHQEDAFQDDGYEHHPRGQRGSYRKANSGSRGRSPRKRHRSYHRRRSDSSVRSSSRSRRRHRKSKKPQKKLQFF